MSSLHGADDVLLVLPGRLHAGELLVDLRHLGTQRFEALHARGVALLGERHLLDLELRELAVDGVDLDRHRVDLDTQPARRLIDEVDGLVGKEAVGDVAVRELRGGHDRAIRDAHAVVDLVLLLQAAQDRDRLLHARLAHEDGLEPALERGVLLDVLAVLVERRRADRVQLAARERGLEHVARIHRAFGRARAHDGVQLVDEEHDLPGGLLDLAKHRLQAVLELASVLRARDHRSEVERDDVLVAQAARHVAGDDALSEPLDDGGLARSRFADEHRIVLRAARQDLDRAADLVDAADHGVELAVARGLREVATVALERLELRLGVLVGDLGARAQLLDRCVEPRGGGAGALERAAGLALVGRERHEQMLAGDVGVLHLLGDLEGVGQHGVEARAHAHLSGRAGDLGRCCQGFADGRVELVRVRADLREDRPDDALGLVEQRLEQVLGFDLACAVLLGDAAGCFERFLRLDGELVESHRLLRLRMRTRGPRCSIRPTGRSVSPFKRARLCGPEPGVTTPTRQPVNPGLPRSRRPARAPASERPGCAGRGVPARARTSAPARPLTSPPDARPHPATRARVPRAPRACGRARLRPAQPPPRVPAERSRA